MIHCAFVFDETRTGRITTAEARQFVPSDGPGGFSKGAGVSPYEACSAASKFAIYI